jgi:WD40 repeat protein
VSSLWDGTIYVWATNEGVVTTIAMINTTYNIRCVAFSPDNKHLLIYHDNIIQVKRITGIMQLEAEQATRIDRAAIAALLGNSACKVPIHDHLIKYIMNFFKAKVNQIVTNWG